MALAIHSLSPAKMSHYYPGSILTAFDPMVLLLVQEEILILAT